MKIIPNFEYNKCIFLHLHCRRLISGLTNILQLYRGIDWRITRSKADITKSVVWCIVCPLLSRESVGLSPPLQSHQYEYLEPSSLTLN